MKEKYLLDSVILIDHLRGVEQATRWLKRLREGSAAISVITRAEVLAGGTREEASAAFALCEQFPCLPLEPENADRAAGLRREYGWKLPDAFQAALAIDHDLRLVTRNTRDFSTRKHPFVLVPYSL